LTASDRINAMWISPHYHAQNRKSHSLEHLRSTPDSSPAGAGSG
jgi:hypothetical protein